MADKEVEKQLGFRDPPDKVTYACSIYMARIIELRGFISFVFRVISSHQQVTNHLTEESKQKFVFEADKYTTFRPTGSSSTRSCSLGQLRLSTSTS